MVLKKSHYQFEEGEVLLFDKELTWTSFDVVKKIKYTTRAKKIGHAGTLDPLATGLLILCTGKKTKTIQDIQNLPKEYEVEMELGATTASYDLETPLENVKDASGITQEQILALLEGFKGQITQLPPIYSAVKVNGRRAYKAARKGQNIELRPRSVFIEELELLEFSPPQKVRLRVRCSKGTYIRSLVHDMGQNLGVGAYVKVLRRTKIGHFDVRDAWLIPDFQAHFQSTLQNQDTHNESI